MGSQRVWCDWATFTCTLPAYTSQVQVRPEAFFFLRSSGLDFTKDKNKPVLFSWSSFLVSQPAPRWAHANHQCVPQPDSSSSRLRKYMPQRPQCRQRWNVLVYCSISHAVSLFTHMSMIIAYFIYSKIWKRIWLCVFSRNKSFHAKVAEWNFWLFQVDGDIALRIPHS